jgi:acetolactate synthase-1/2/3 large subunit
MRDAAAPATGGRIVAETLRDLGAETIFSLSGNQILPIFDAAGDCGLKIIHVRHESAAVFAAAASAELTERPGVALVSAGPGFVAAFLGLATAKSLELPLLFLSGASDTTEAGMGSFQDLDQAGMARVVCKETMAVDSAADVSSTLSRAWRLAQAPVPGPVHVSLPKDVLLGVSRTRGVEALEAPAVALSAADEAILAAMARKLVEAERPLVIGRPSAGRGRAGDCLRSLARRLGIESVITECPRGLSDLKYRSIIRRYPESDCALVVAPADFAVGFLSRSAIARDGAILLVDAPGDPRPRRAPDLHLQLPPEVALPYLVDATASRPSAPAELRAGKAPPESESTAGLHPLQVAQCIGSLLEPDDIVVLDGGEFCQWVRLGLADLPNRLLWNSKLGAIGGAIPMALGISASGHPGRTIAIMGDGAFGYHASEIETAARHELPMVLVVGNDARWAAEWHLQVSRYGADRTFGTELTAARYDRVATGFGADGFPVTELEALRDALAAAFSQRGPVCLNVRILSVRSPAITS